MRTFIAAMAIFLATTAQANLQVFPTRLTLNDSARSAMLSVRNRSDKAEEFHILVSFFRMKRDGTLEAAEEPGPNDRALTKDDLRFSPRKFRLEAGAEQVVRVLLAKSGEMPDGEYRCHLTIEPVVSEEDKPKGVASKGPLKIVLEAKLAVAIPVFFRHGKPTFATEMENLHLVSTPDGGTAAVLDWKFTGDAYPFGEFHAMLSKSGGEGGDEVGIVRGVAAYISPRAVTIPLTVPKDKLSGKTLRVEFRLPETETAAKTLEAKIP